MSKIKILAIVGSLRKESFNRQLALAAKEAIGAKAEFEILDYGDVPPMNQDFEFPPPDSVKRVRDKIKEADGIWFFTAEYNHFLPGILKNLIDWLSRPISACEPQVLAGKPAAISGITPSMAGTALAQDNLVTLISFLDMDIMNQPRLTIPNASEQLNGAGQLELQSSKPFLEMQVKAFIEFVEKRVG